MAYIGQDLYVSGFEMGKRIVELVPSGDVALFIATPGALNIQPRIDGAIAAIKQSGKPVKATAVATSPDLATELSMIDAYYQGHKSLKGMFAVDAGDTQGVGQVIQKYRLQGKVKGGGYDLLPGTLKLIQNGSLQFTIDQQPYLQGFYPVIQLFLQKLSGGLVAPSDTNTGLLFVTKDNVRPYLNTKTRYHGSSKAAQVPGLVALAGADGEMTTPRAARRLGWRVAGLFVRRREASIFVVAVLLCIYFSLESAAFYSTRQPQEHHRDDGADRADRGRPGDAPDLRRDRPRGRARLRARARDRLRRLLGGAVRLPDLGRDGRRARLLGPRRPDERRDHDVPPRARRSSRPSACSSS